MPPQNRRTHHLIGLASLLLSAAAIADRTDPVASPMSSTVTEAAAPTAAATETAASEAAAVETTATAPAAGPATLPPAPNMLDDPRIAPAISPYATPYLTPALRDADRAYASDFGPDPDAEPLWVLPEHLIPKTPTGIPGARMTRDRGYLDSPETIDGIATEPLSRDSGRLDEGLAWDYCGPRTRRSPASPAPASPSKGEPIDVDAGGLTYRQNTEVIDAVGGVTLARTGQRVEADSISYNRRTGDVVTNGQTYLEYPRLRILGSGAELNLDNNQGRIDNAHYRLSGQINLRGRADVAHIDSPEVTRFDDIIYTSCPPGSDAWTLRAGTLKLDQDTGRGTATNARLRIRGIPVLYTPYIDFPIDDRRKSGFLIPSIGSSDTNGFELITPYYWNIAPNMDATLYPRYMSKRGLMLGGDFRYLTRRDKGSINAEVIPNDALYQDGSARAALNVEEQGVFFKRFQTTIDYSVVSDDQYLQDLGNNIDATSTRYLTQSGDVTYLGTGWSLLTRVQAFQTVDQTLNPGSRPYGRLPQLLFTLRPRTLGPGLVAGMDAEYDFFDHNHLVHGQRLSMLPSLSWPLRRSYGHIIPGARLHLADYGLTDQSADLPTDPSHAIPSFDLDGKLIFERDMSWLGTASLQTLEPRLYYLYTPYVDQDDTPVFDSSELTFSFSNLFRSNRFTGRDRIGDANQLTAALTSRTLRADNGDELFRLSLGQIFYFADRLVQINGPEQTTERSPYTGELSAQLFQNWYGRASFEWDPNLEEEQWQRRTLQLEYRHPEDRILNLAYRADDSVAVANRYENTDMSFRLPVGNRVEVVGRWLYSVLHDETMDAFAGVEFGKCCWRVRLLGRHFKRRPEDAASTSVMLQLELAGLGAIGNPIGKFLEQEIYGYQVD